MASAWKAGFVRRVCVVFMVVVGAPAVHAESGRWSLLEDNDGMISHEDQHYTQGLQLSYLTPALQGGGWSSASFDALGSFLPMYRLAPGSQRRIELLATQTMYTPVDLHRNPPDPYDRPYAGWLYGGIDWLQENHQHSLHDLEFQAGIVGPAALAKQVQNGFHGLIGLRNADGWSEQLKNRGAFQLSYEFKRKLKLSLSDGYALDAVPELGFDVGSVLRYVETGGLLRFGNALDADYGPSHIRPALSGSDFFDGSRLGGSFLHWYVFAGVQLRRVLYNRLIDGASEVSPVDLEHRPWVTDALLGASFVLSPRVRAEFTATRRSREFYGQQGDDIYGSGLLSVSF